MFMESFDVLKRAPAGFLIVVVLNLVGEYLRWSNWFPNRCIPVVLVGLGTALYCLLGNRSSVSPEQPHPEIILGLIGFILGAVAWLLHGTLLAWAVKRFGADEAKQQQAKGA